MEINDFYNSSISEEKLKTFFIENDRLFPDPFTNHIDTDKYIERLLKLGNILVAEENSEIAGFAGLYANDYEDYSGHLQAILVAEPYQGKGIGRALVEAVLAFCKERNMKKVFLNVDLSNYNAKRLYSQIGFVDSEIKHNNKNKKIMEFVFD